MYRELTNGIEVVAEPAYVPEKSQPEKGVYFFAYQITITNREMGMVQLRSRHWIITDGHGQVHEVQGEGVVGEQPLLGNGESFTYSSFCPLPTPTGNMRGTYTMEAVEEGQSFRIRIPLFFLRADTGTA
ncbi:MAG: Co2+/Mg2+ efflux protein ApaG [Bdellovibrionales bacterium]|nr:Co2+/Mg2+ efflux protein ApaG [Bdellovibrionales bacterium]